MPLGHHHEQRFAVDAPEHASKTSAVKVDSLQHLTTFANTHTTLVGDVAVPAGAFGGQANAVGDAVAEIGPHSLVRQAALNRDVEGCEFLAVGLGADERRVVWCDRHPIGKSDAIGHLSSRTIRLEQGDGSSGELAAWKLKAQVIDVGVPATVNDYLVPGMSYLRKAPQ